MTPASPPVKKETLNREDRRHYISADERDIETMLSALDIEHIEDLFSFIPRDVRFEGEITMPEEMDRETLKKHVETIARKNKSTVSFMGDGLPVYRVPPIIPYLLGLRPLTTSYTPYQPERSQGTLNTQWIYQCLLSQITGMEAVNASLYDRATALYEAILWASRMKRGKRTAVVLDSLHPNDREVIHTLAGHTELRIASVEGRRDDSGCLPLELVRKAVETHREDAFALVFPQVNNLGLLENVDALTDLAHASGLLAVAVIDPMLLATGGLKPPSDFGAAGADAIAGEGQHIAMPAQFGGPGLGIFGVRYNEKQQTNIRHTAGRYVGQARDISGHPCKVLVLATREQHIRREKANSNICSNQAYLATLAGAALLARGEEGLIRSYRAGYDRAREAAHHLSRYQGVSLAYSRGAFANEIILRLPCPSEDLIRKAAKASISLGVDVSSRVEGEDHLLLLSFTDLQSDGDMKKLYAFFDSHFSEETKKDVLTLSLPTSICRKGRLALPEFPESDLIDYYDKLAAQNISPDDACYPLGSCTMKYNPTVNDYAAALPGFTAAHPQSPIEINQGCLEILYHIQEFFKAITGLDAVTTQPVAGAQGELVGIKLFQTYHRSRGEKRDILLIPRSAHGTNPATAAMAGFARPTEDGLSSGIVLLEADRFGEIDMNHFEDCVKRFGRRIAGIMITHPNTSGIFETQFRKMAGMIRETGGLVYLDGANMNAIAGWVDLKKLGVDAVHNNLHKTWSIPHGGGGPGDAIVAVSKRLAPFLPGHQVVKKDSLYVLTRMPQSIGSFHRHLGNFAHKVRCYTYLRALGPTGIKRMSAVAVLSARYIQRRLADTFVILPKGTGDTPRMHEFIISLDDDTFRRLEAEGIPRRQIIPRFGKLFLDFGFHAPTVAFPEVDGLMIEPTESYSKVELDRFVDTLKAMRELLDTHPGILSTVPHFTPVDRVDEVGANREVVVSERLTKLPPIPSDRISQKELIQMNLSVIQDRIVEAHLRASEIKSN